MQLIDNPPVMRVNIKKVNGSSSADADDHVAVEEPLEIQLQYVDAGERVKKNISVTMRTPGFDKALAVGFLLTEGVILSAQQVQEVKSITENSVLVSLGEGEKPILQKAERNFYTTSSCGVCGKSSIDAIKTVSAYQSIKNETVVSAEIIYSLVESLQEQQAIFQSTGGLHASALFDLGGNFLMLREDVGRHNALDKLIGEALLNKKLPLNNCILLLSGRSSFELIQKASMAGIKIVAAIGAPSSLAVELAYESDITLMGFLRDKRFNIYSGAQRIKLD